MAEEGLSAHSPTFFDEIAKVGRLAALRAALSSLPASKMPRTMTTDTSTDALKKEIWSNSFKLGTVAAAFVAVFKKPKSQREEGEAVRVDMSQEDTSEFIFSPISVGAGCRSVGHRRAATEIRSALGLNHSERRKDVGNDKKENKEVGKRKGTGGDGNDENNAVRSEAVLSSSGRGANNNNKAEYKDMDHDASNKQHQQQHVISTLAEEFSSACVLYDGHAEVMARRAFNAYLLDEMEAILDMIDLKMDEKKSNSGLSCEDEGKEVEEEDEEKRWARATSSVRDIRLLQQPHLWNSNVGSHTTNKDVGSDEIDAMPLLVPFIDSNAFSVTGAKCSAGRGRENTTAIELPVRSNVVVSFSPSPHLFGIYLWISQPPCGDCSIVRLAQADIAEDTSNNLQGTFTGTGAHVLMTKEEQALFEKVVGCSAASLHVNSTAPTATSEQRLHHCGVSSSAPQLVDCAFLADEAAIPPHFCPSCRSKKLAPLLLASGSSIGDGPNRQIPQTEQQKSVCPWRNVRAVQNNSLSTEETPEKGTGYKEQRGDKAEGGIRQNAVDGIDVGMSCESCDGGGGSSTRAGGGKGNSSALGNNINHSYSHGGGDDSDDDAACHYPFTQQQIGRRRTKPGAGVPTLSMSCTDKVRRWMRWGPLLGGEERTTVINSSHDDGRDISGAVHHGEKQEKRVTPSFQTKSMRKSGGLSLGLLSSVITRASLSEEEEGEKRQEEEEAITVRDGEKRWCSSPLPLSGVVVDVQNFNRSSTDSNNSTHNESSVEVNAVELGEGEKGKAELNRSGSSREEQHLALARGLGCLPSQCHIYDSSFSSLTGKRGREEGNVGLSDGFAGSARATAQTVQDALKETFLFNSSVSAMCIVRSVVRAEAFGLSNSSAHVTSTADRGGGGGANVLVQLNTKIGLTMGVTLASVAKSIRRATLTHNKNNDAHPSCAIVATCFVGSKRPREVAAGEGVEEKEQGYFATTNASPHLQQNHAGGGDIREEPKNDKKPLSSSSLKLPCENDGTSGNSSIPKSKGGPAAAISEGDGNERNPLSPPLLGDLLHSTILHSYTRYEMARRAAAILHRCTHKKGEGEQGATHVPKSYRALKQRRRGGRPTTAKPEVAANKDMHCVSDDCAPFLNRSCSGVCHESEYDAQPWVSKGIARDFRFAK